MGFKKTIEELILSRSNSYKFYKDFYEKHNGVSSKQLDVQLAKLQKDFNQYKKKNDEYVKSCNFLLNSLFIDYELNNPNPLLDSIQKLCTELLCFVENICIKYDLEWWLDVGNLLGAVRHGNFVPWDDDVDIGMMRKDYNQLNAVIVDEVNSHNLDDIVQILYRPRKVPKLQGAEVGSFLQLYVRHPIERKPNPRLAGVDVFPYDYMNCYNEHSLNDEYYDAKIRYYGHLAEDLSYEKSLKGLYEDLNLNMERADYLVPGVEGAFGKNNLYKLHVMETDKVFPLKELPFGDKVFPVPNDYRYYLELVYGKYLSVPMNVRRHPRIQHLRYSSDVLDVYDSLLNRFREINKNF